MDLRELFADDEEALRSAVAGILKHLHTAHVTIVAQDSDGHTVASQPAVKRRDVDQNGNVSFNDHPLVPEQPLHFVGGGGVTLTHAIKTGDELPSIITSRPFGGWFQSGGTQQPTFPRTQSLSDAVALSGVRSTPRKIPQVSTSSSQLRDDAKRHVTDHDPQAGITHKSADASTPPASDTFDPFTQASKFISHIVQAAKGVVGSAVDGGTEHSHGVDHGVGAWMKAASGLHSVLADPTAGASLNAKNLLHRVLAHPDIGAALMGQDGASSVIAKATVALKSATGISLDCPPGGLSLPSGSIGGSSMSEGAAASNVGALGGDLAGELPNPQVVGILHVVGADQLPKAVNDAAAAALTPPVPVGGLYRNDNFVLSGTYSGSPITLSASGLSVVCVRMV